VKTKYINIIYDTLRSAYPDAKCDLIFESAWELLVATILSAQCTDERVNQVTKELFKLYRDVTDYTKLDLGELEKLIRSTGFYKQKARYIKEAAYIIVNEYNSEVPKEMKHLLKLPGVARKTANVVLSQYFHINEGIVVDTHVIRLSNRLGFSKYNNAEKIEKDLMNLIENSKWEAISTLLKKHGRLICKARKPKCNICMLKGSCPSANLFK
jgi:endonuclease-3